MKARNMSVIGAIPGAAPSASGSRDGKPVHIESRRSPVKTGRRRKTPVTQAMALNIMMVMPIAPTQPSEAQPVFHVDRPGDTRIIRTDLGGDGPVEPTEHRLPDLLWMSVGRYSSPAPHVDPFVGAWHPTGGFVRINLAFVGLVNPPGPLGFDDEGPEYDPFRYGPNPVFGYIEFDVDSDEDTGGELDDPELRYNGAVARFGGLPSEARFTDRIALNRWAFDDDITTAPWVDRSGEEFHIVLLGEALEDITVRLEKPGGNPAVFEEGEVWDTEGDWFHRSHGWEEFLLMCPPRDGRYKPDVWMQFAHVPGVDVTIVSLVIPLTNAACATLEGPVEPVEPNDGCDNNQYSILEALTDLNYSATHADPWSRQLPEFQLLAAWEFKNPANHLNPTEWRINALVGTAYPAPQELGARFVWTDVWPDVRNGDYDGDGCLTTADTAALQQYIDRYDGVEGIDDDGDGGNGQIAVHQFAHNFTLFDADHDGACLGTECPVAGDMNLDGALSSSDVADFVLALLDPEAYWVIHQIDPLVRGDVNCDDSLNGLDVAAFAALIVNQP